jgi:hypothetical protein
MPGEGTGAENGYGLVRRVSSVEPRDGYGKTPRLGRQNGCRGGGAWSETVKSDAAGGQRVRERQRPCGEAWPGMMGVPLVSAVRRPRGWVGGKCRRGDGVRLHSYTLRSQSTVVIENACVDVTMSDAASAWGRRTASRLASQRAVRVASRASWRAPLWAAHHAFSS